MKQILHVAQCAIASNRKHGTSDPAIIVRNHQGSERHNEVELVVDGKVVGKFIYRPHEPLACGARLWLESDSNVLELRPVNPIEMKEAA